MNVVTKKIIGVFLVLAGIVIFLTPFTPGSAIGLVGLDFLFGENWPWWKRTKARIRRAFK